VLVGRLKQEEKSHNKGISLFDSKEEGGLIPKELRSLCISLLGSGLEEKRSLEASVNAILQKNEQWNETRAQEEIEEREKDLQRLRQEKAEIENRLRAIREAETYTQNIADGAYRGTAAKIARAVISDSDKYSWFTDRIVINTECPLSEAELFRLLKELRVLTPEKKKELGYSWPNSVPTASQFENLVKVEQQAIQQENNTATGINKRFLQDLSHCPEQIVRSIHEFLLQLLNEIHRLKSRPYKWIPDAIRDVLSENTAIWQELHKKSASIISQITKIVPKVDPIEITLPEGHNLKSVLEDALRLKEHLGHGGRLGWGPFCPKLVKSVRYIIRTIRINGRPCNNLDRVTSLAAVLHVRVNLEQGCTLWGGRFEKTQGQYSMQFRLFEAHTETLRDTLLLTDKANQCKEALKQHNIFFEPVWSDEDRLQTLMLTCEHRLARINRQKTENEISQTESPIVTIARSSDFHPVVKELLEAIKLRNVDAFARASSKIDELNREKASAQWVHETLQRLSEVAPNLAENLSKNCVDACWNERVQQMHKAWRWAQARNWLEEYICKDDMSSLVQRERQITDEIGKTIAQIASLRAWSFCFNRMNENHRRHMGLWRQSISKVTKSGRGKYDNLRRREAQKSLNKCREAVPAWVMPLHRVWDTVDPSPEMFDVIVVDEASQCGFEALPLFFLGKKILIVGDDKQISPDPVGIELSQVYKQLMEKYLYDFEFKASFALEDSLFDHGKLRFGTRRIALREHFRCMPEIIRFSNDLCYSDTPLIPLRQYPPNRLPPLMHVYIQNGYREGSESRVINRPEAEAIVKKIVELCHNDKYADKTMGVIVLQGKAQAGLIDEQLLEQLGAEEMERRHLICGEPYSFQGDERDIIFLSMVAAPNERIGAFAKPADERRFNVAASRARDQMWLFHSATCNDLGSSCLRRRLLEFFEGTRIPEIAGINVNELNRQAVQANRSIVKPPEPFESWFEVDVALEIASKGYRVIPQFEIAGKYIDLVIEGGQGRLAVECDGDEWHGAERYEQDMQRQRILERCGLVFYRIRESSFYTDKENALKRLWLLLEEREIFPQRVDPRDGSVEDEKTSEDMVEVGDTVVYRDEQEPDLELQAMITHDSSNPELGAINFYTPIAQAMLGSSVEQVVEVKLPTSRKYLRIIKIKKKSSQA
jgi:transcription elongation GreA/GreB family factor